MLGVTVRFPGSWRAACNPLQQRRENREGREWLLGDGASSGSGS